jgi:hypothetical protein
MTAETELRYWPRIGMRVSKTTAQSFIDRLASGHGGSRLDEDLEEFTTITPITAEELVIEVETLFASPESSEGIEMDPMNLAILQLMTYESRRKQYIMEFKESGMSLEEAKEAYEEGKRALVREHLDLPEPEDSDSDSEEE